LVDSLCWFGPTGEWGDHENKWVGKNIPVNVTPGNTQTLVTDPFAVFVVNTNNGGWAVTPFWSRFTITDVQIDPNDFNNKWNGTGPPGGWSLGETEDQLVVGDPNDIPICDVPLSGHWHLTENCYLLPGTYSLEGTLYTEGFSIFLLDGAKITLDGIFITGEASVRVFEGSTIIVRAPPQANHPPVAVDGFDGVLAGGMVTIDLKNFVSDLDGSGDINWATLILGHPQLGIVVDQGNGVVEYTSFGEPGEDLFSFQVSDMQGAESNTAFVFINIEFPP
jgi:hypothetical protein